MLDLVRRKSATGPTGLLSEALLLPGTGSVTPAGGLTVAVLSSEPTVPGGTVPLTVNVTVPPTGSDTSVSIAPLPDAGHEPPDPPAHVQVKAASGAGSGSCTRALTTSLGPRLVTVIV